MTHGITDESQTCLAALLKTLGLAPMSSSTIVLHLDPLAKLATVELTVRVRSHKPLARVTSSAHTASRDASTRPSEAHAMR
tara:strand:- start:206 stop:448 length:243 start_codon:yes stop_codon:yes gene_type:complete